jgi:UDP-N-acetylglucosamine 2-epimerase
MFKEQNKEQKVHFYRNFSPEDYARVLNNASCLIGNSSSFIREGSYLGVPAVLIGDRQEGREHGPNVFFVEHDSKKIADAIKKQVNKRRFEPSFIFGKGDAGEKIARVLTKIDLNINKRMTY